MLVRTIHRWSAGVLVIFLSVHLANHLVALAGVSAHLATMELLRTVYRAPIVEPVLLAAFAIQITTGLTRVVAGWQARSGRVAWLQAGSGLYIALFLVIHVAAVLTARSDGVDTNFHFAAAGLHVAGYKWFFAPYYSLAVASVFAHVGCALYWMQQDRADAVAAQRAITVMIGLGVIAAGLIVSMMAGFIVPVTVPGPYLAAFGS